MLRPETRAQLGCPKLGNSLLVSSFLCPHLIAPGSVSRPFFFYRSQSQSQSPALLSPYPFHSGCPLFRSLFGNIVCVSRSGLETGPWMRDARRAGTFFYNPHVCLGFHLEGFRLRLKKTVSHHHQLRPTGSALPHTISWLLSPCEVVSATYLEHQPAPLLGSIAPFPLWVGTSQQSRHHVVLSVHQGSHLLATRSWSLHRRRSSSAQPRQPGTRVCLQTPREESGPHHPLGCPPGLPNTHITYLFSDIHT